MFQFKYIEKYGYSTNTGQPRHTEERLKKCFLQCKPPNPPFQQIEKDWKTLG